MHKTRLEAFSDGVIAIIITIMVLELKIPHDFTLDGLIPLSAKFGCYAMSFVFIAIYWNNHHHLLQAADCVNGRILWANVHLLFWLSLVPFATDWMGESGFSQFPVAFYGLILILCGTAYYFLSRALVRQHGKDSAIAKAIGSDFKGKISVVVYGLGIIASCCNTWLSVTLYVSVSVLWLIPDRRIEKEMGVQQC